MKHNVELSQEELLLLRSGLKSHKDMLYRLIEDYKEQTPDATECIKDCHKEISRCTALQKRLDKFINK